ncbi:hypothetical protein [Tumebacillus permanentifrigoris]|uniref:Uncharacterized protein n=1 Tax=Tumebacillus permanentifrigoris TaxID=378543 RepID=A0A316DD41_9BACL|nr:hypothetical protein [Tumebacillus permanentifrigoris]PWK14423.1 hypothetical protein C7459_105181 [Tumebacillus permanentifrigoris]
MSNQQQDEQSQDKKKQKKKPPSTLPKAMEKRLSLKWLTMQALEASIARLQAQGGQPRVTILTAFGQIEGELQDIRASYAESFVEEANGQYKPDLASMVTHLRSELLRTYEEQEKQIEIVDTAPILSLRDVVLQSSGSDLSTKLPQLTLFADQVIGFALSDVPTVQ